MSCKLEHGSRYYNRTIKYFIVLYYSLINKKSANKSELLSYVYTSYLFIYIKITILPNLIALLKSRAAN